ncbi:hypothetical protein ACFL38_01495 [Candidatus Omnitrophota bacterium]
MVWFEIFRVIVMALMFFALAGTIIVLCSPRLYKALNGMLIREYGLKKRIAPALEQDVMTFDEWFFTRRKSLSICCIAACVFVLARI